VKNILNIFIFIMYDMNEDSTSSDDEASQSMYISLEVNKNPHARIYLKYNLHKPAVPLNMRMYMQREPQPTWEWSGVGNSFKTRLEDDNDRSNYMSELSHILHLLILRHGGSYNYHNNHIPPLNMRECNLVALLINLRHLVKKAIFLRVYIAFRKRRFIARIIARKWWNMRWNPHTAMGKARLMREFSEMENDF
jgi:hypothetical protein